MRIGTRKKKKWKGQRWVGRNGLKAPFPAGPNPTPLASTWQSWAAESLAGNRSPGFHPQCQLLLSFPSWHSASTCPSSSASFSDYLYGWVLAHCFWVPYFFPPLLWFLWFLFFRLTYLAYLLHCHAAHKHLPSLRAISQTEAVPAPSLRLLKVSSSTLQSHSLHWISFQVGAGCPP